MYSPPIKIFIGGVNPLYILIAISIVFCIIRKNELLSYLHPFKVEVFWFLCIVFYSMVRSGGEYIQRYIVSLVCAFAAVPFILFLANRIGICNKDRLIRAIMIVSAVASCITMLCVFFPELDNYVRTQLIQYDEENYLYENARRGFGIASTLTSHYGYIQGTVIAICPFFLKENKWFVFFIPFIILSILVNARTGIIIATWGIMVYSFVSRQKIALPLVAIVFIMYFYLEDIMIALNFNPETIAWIMDFSDQMGDISSGDFSGETASTMTGSMVVWPSDVVEWLVGKGVVLYHNPFATEHTDVGWFIQLNYGGLFYIFIFFTPFVIMAKRLARLDMRILMIILAGTVVIVNTKSSIFPNTGEFTFLMLLYFICVLDKLGLLQSAR